MNNRPGCLAGIFKLSILKWLYDWLQNKFGSRSGSCMGCGCGLIIFIVFAVLALSVIFGTDWFKLWAAISPLI